MINKPGGFEKHLALPFGDLFSLSSSVRLTYYVREDKNETLSLWAVNRAFLCNRASAVHLSRNVTSPSQHRSCQKHISY